MACLIYTHCGTISFIFSGKNTRNDRSQYWINAFECHLERYNIYLFSIAFVYILNSVLLLIALPVGNWTIRDIDFNEQFRWDAAHDMQNSYHMALKRGLPYPILTVAEYFSLGREGFAWGGQYRAAGYFASIMLWASFASWLVMNLLLVAVPRYGAYCKVVTGLLLISTNFGYSWLVPKPQLVIIMEGGRLTFHYGWCFWLILVAGILCLFVGIVISVIDLVWPHTFSTIVEVYFDTPYDRHVILEESHDVRYQKRNSRTLDESLGHKILRRLSSKTRDMNGSTTSNGIDNRAYQRDVPNSPWHYSHRQRPLHAPLHRTISEDSTASMQMEMQPIQKMVISRKLP